MTHDPSPWTSVYGPVKSWRFGRSLGIDPIGPVSTCGFNCVYCQLGEIQCRTNERHIFVSTEKVVQELKAFANSNLQEKPGLCVNLLFAETGFFYPSPNIDVVTLSGSGEPTQALNLAEILTAAKQIIQRPTVVLTNSSLLSDQEVRDALQLADIVAAKLDAVSSEQLRRINRPVSGIDLADIWAGLRQFRQEYRGHLAIQTMILSPWCDETQAEYIWRMQQLMPDEIQLNTPTRPRPFVPQIQARSNETQCLPYPVQKLKPMSADVLQALANKIQSSTGIVVRMNSAN